VVFLFLAFLARFALVLSFYLLFSLVCHFSCLLLGLQFFLLRDGILSFFWLLVF
jgi:hypothetical protein